MKNALGFLCLAGGHLQEKKKRALEVYMHEAYVRCVKAVRTVEVLS